MVYMNSKAKEFLEKESPEVRKVVEDKCRPGKDGEDIRGDEGGDERRVRRLQAMES